MNGKLARMVGFSGIAILGVFGLLGTRPFMAKAPARIGTPAVTPNAFSIATRPVEFVFGGDVMLGRAVGYDAQKTGDYAYPFSGIRQIFKAADVSSINLESPLYAPCVVSSKASMQFCAETRFAHSIADAGITTVSFANNHTMDDGAQGVADTNRFLNQSGVVVVNNASSSIETVAGKKIGFVSFNLTWGNVKDEDIRFMILDLRKKVDFIVVNFHWGEEYRATPTPEQKRIARLAIDAGADVVVGHHPHVLEPIQRYRGKYIFYSLGNLIFDQFWSEQTKLGALIRFYWFSDTGATSYDVVPVIIGDAGQPRILAQDATSAQGIMKSLQAQF